MSHIEAKDNNNLFYYYSSSSSSYAHDQILAVDRDHHFTSSPNIPTNPSGFLGFDSSLMINPNYTMDDFFYYNNNNYSSATSSISNNNTTSFGFSSSSYSDQKSKGNNNNKNGNSNKKGEKKQKEPRFAFMTKSEVDHLEDGYRWRKYGQKAVKNSPYPRCTTQKCGVKKRVERSYQDPSTVITTYEGTHNHPLPSSLRGTAAAAAAMFPPSMSSLIGGAATATGIFPHQDQYNTNNNNSLFGQMPNYIINNNTNNVSSSTTSTAGILSHHHDDFGLLQDMVSGSMFLKQEP
ncbi:hypothetical protein G4B88_009707 [Cannabis sativa]|uniref:WRKY domain-containing protein n=1 Tax=Cannabis sativa TaxID=3483 RepID=A0A7J6EG06_CANSA|nr:hypothetical protein G4B88_009707 [Cannabis sativa]